MSFPGSYQLSELSATSGTLMKERNYTICSFLIKKNKQEIEILKNFWRVSGAVALWSVCRATHPLTCSVYNVMVESLSENRLFPLLLPYSSLLFFLHDSMEEANPHLTATDWVQKISYEVRKCVLPGCHKDFCSTFLLHASVSTVQSKHTKHNLLGSLLAEIFFWTCGSFNSMILPTFIKIISEIIYLIKHLRKNITGAHKHKENDEGLVLG